MPELPTAKVPSSGGFSLHPAFYIINWMILSNATILFNKWLIDGAGFRYPIILTCWHLVFATATTQLLSRTTTLLDGRHKVKMTGRTYLRAIVPIGVFYSASLVCSNLAYMYLNVAFIQMLKASAPVAVLLVSYLWGVLQPTTEKVLTVIGIAAGVTLASVGEVAFSWAGLLFQAGGIVFEAIRLVMIQVLLNGDEGSAKMDPLVSLYYFAPPCAVMSLFAALPTEIPSFHSEDLFRTGLSVLVLNAVVAFMLNVASVFLIGKTSGLVLTLSGILKAIALVAFSFVFRGEVITLLQLAGYAAALFGLAYYSLGGAQMKELASSAGARVSDALDDSKLSPPARWGVSAALAVLIVVMLVFGLNVGGAEALDVKR